jgi:ammonium transporter, Amt family
VLPADAKYFDFAHQLSTGDTAWVLVSAALVLIMTPGLAFFYGGMVRSKNVLGMLMQNYVTIGIVSVIWVLFVYSIAFGKDAGVHGLFGNLHQFGLAHMHENVAGYGTVQTIPPLVFVAFQLMFAVITPALITGATADRLKFGSFVVFVVLWVTLVYGPIAHWVFSPEGWLFKKGAEDFAGGTVVHANAGAAGLALALVAGKRLGWPKEQMKPHNVPFVLLGAALLWFGWFGFNAGSALGANNLAGYAFVNTNTATAAALLGWIFLEKIRDGKPTTLGAASGAVAGLVAITPAAGFVSPVGSIILGFVAGALCSACTVIKFKLGFDDSLDVVAVHLVGGVAGALMIGFLGTKATGIGVDGLFYGGGAHLLRLQAETVGATVGYSFLATLIIGYLIKVTIGLRMSPEDELEGMDSTMHAEAAYEFGSGLGARSLVGSGAAHSEAAVHTESVGARALSLPGAPAMRPAGEVQA